MSQESQPRRIVSSNHLAEGSAWEASEFEFGLIVAHNAFTRWITKCMAAAGQPDLSALDTLILHNVNHREREKRLSDICFVLNIDDTHTVNYALKKLVKIGLIGSQKRGKEVFYTVSTLGAETCELYRSVREQCLLDTLGTLDLEGQDLRNMARLLRSLSGQYDQASRAAASL